MSDEAAPAKEQVQERALQWIAKHKHTGGGLATAFVDVSQEALLGIESEVVTRELALPDSAWDVDPDALEETAICTCGHALSSHREPDGPGHAGCRADVPIEGANSEKGEEVYEECPCPGFISRDLEVAPDYADSAE